MCYDHPHFTDEKIGRHREVSGRVGNSNQGSLIVESLGLYLFFNSIFAELLLIVSIKKIKTQYFQYIGESYRDIKGRQNRTPL